MFDKSTEGERDLLNGSDCKRKTSMAILIMKEFVLMRSKPPKATNLLNGYTRVVRNTMGTREKREIFLMGFCF